MNGRPLTLAVTAPAGVLTLVTPGMAREWLAANSGNRTVRANAVSRLASVIRGGGWQVTHQGIAFLDDGTLADGQHRLLAIVQAGVAVEVVITRGMTRAQLAAIDGKIAGPRDPFDVVGFADGVRVESHIRGWIMAALELSEHGHLMKPMGRSVAASRAAIASHLSAALALRAGMNGTIGREPPAAVMGSMIIARPSDPDAVGAFLRSVKTGENLARYSPALVLRDYIAKHAGHATGATGRESTSLRTFSALDSYMSGQSIKTLRESAGARDRFVAAWKRAAQVSA